MCVCVCVCVCVCAHVGLSRNLAQDCVNTQAKVHGIKKPTDACTTQYLYIAYLYSKPIVYY